MKVSVIIAVYKDIEALELIFESLVYQAYKNFEIIVAEDGQSDIMNKFIALAKAKYNFTIIHSTQEDIGVRKSRSQNNGIKAAQGEYLIFIDGDCILYSDFIENHIALARENSVITGRRVNVGPKYSKKLRDKSITSLWLEKNFIRKYLDIKEDAKDERHSEEGFKIKPNGLIDKLIKRLRKKEFPMLGCNMSFYKKAMLDINGFDEGLGNSAMAGDTDLSWRFKGLGYTIVSARFIANQFHLYHQRNPNDYDRSLDQKMISNQKRHKFRCTDGIVKL